MNHPETQTAPGGTLADIEIPGAGSLEGLSHRQPVLLVFLRHFG